MKNAIRIARIPFAFIVLMLVAAAGLSAQQLDQIREAIKQKGQKWVAEETSISVLPDHEKLRRLGLLKRKATGVEPVLSMEEPPAGLSAAVDWTNYATPVRNQGSCGSCWAFATTAALESQLLMRDNRPLTEDNRAEQLLVSCSGAGSCDGGYIGTASNYIKNTGLPPESYYPYSATDNSCIPASGWEDAAARIGAWSYVNTSPANLGAIKNALSNYGPLVTTMDVYSDFFSYHGGVYEYATGSLQGGHAILIVGYTDDASVSGGGYFKVKNSWGTGWGSQGYFLIAYSQLGNAVYFGEWTLAYSTPVIPPIPAAPDSLTATPISSSQINLSWISNSTNEDGFRIEGCSGAGCVNYALVATAPAGATSFSKTGLSANTYYSYRVQAFNAGGYSAPSNTAGAITFALQPPVAPAALQATAISAGQINFGWTEASNNEDGLKIERCKGAGCSSGFVQIATVAAGVQSYSNTGLLAGTTYTYRVRAYNAGGNSEYSGTVGATTFCTCTLTPSRMTLAAKGGQATVNVNTSAECSWTAETTANWITFTGAPNDTGPGAFAYSVSATSTRRTGTITVLGQVHSVTQNKK